MIHKWRNFFCGILLLVFLCLQVRPVYAEETEISDVCAPGYVLMEAEPGTVICQKEKDVRRSPASVTKVMTLLLIFDHLENGSLKLEDKVITSAYAKSMGGSQVFLEEGEEQTVETMIKCIVIASGNDASVAMAEHISGNEQDFVKEMNERAEGLAEDPEAERKMLWQLVLSLKAEIEQLKKHVMTGASDPADHSGEFSPVPSVTSLVKYPEADLIGIHSVPTSLEEAEKTTIAETLARNGGNKRKTAEDLNISLRTLYRKLQEYEIQ